MDSSSGNCKMAAAGWLQPLIAYLPPVSFGSGCAAKGFAGSPIYQPWKSDSPLNLVGTEASGTCVHMAGSSIDDGLDPLHIGAPGTVGTSVGMGNLDTKGNTLTAIITLRHFLHLPSG